jgi:hypothetical protein
VLVSVLLTTDQLTQYTKHTLTVHTLPGKGERSKKKGPLPLMSSP